MIDTLILIWEHLQHPLVAIIWLHFFADFILQTDYVAINKSKNSKILLQHVTIYSIPFLWFGWQFALINGVLHFVTDYITSRTAGWFWQREQRHWFFVTIGFDQAIHLTTLFVTYSILIGI